jgi:hypothetical protein
MKYLIILLVVILYVGLALLGWAALLYMAKAILFS